MGTCTLFFEVNKRTPKFKAQFNSFISVNIQQWNKANESAKNLQKYWLSSEGAKVMALTQAVENAVDDLFLSGRIRGKEDKQLINDAISSVVFADERKRIAEEQARKEAEERAAHEREQAKYKDILAFYDRYVTGIREGIVTIGGREYRLHTIRAWEAFGNHLRAFLSNRTEKTFDDITPMMRDEFVKFMKSEGFMKDSVFTYVAKFRALCKAAAKYGYNTNAVSLTGWETGRADKSEKKAAVYLTEVELQKLYEMPLEGTRAFVRDVFFVGAMIAQRFSDYSRISKDMVMDANGVKFLAFTQQKTGKEMVIPITDERALEILAKYDYTFRYISLPTFDEYLHDIFEELSDSVPSLCEELPTAPTKADPRTTKQKWELISSHTARRSAVTNMYKSGLLDKREMMAISGHTTEKIFEDYIKLGTLEQAKRIADKLSQRKAVNEDAKVC